MEMEAKPSWYFWAVHDGPGSYDKEAGEILRGENDLDFDETVVELTDRVMAEYMPISWRIGQTRAEYQTALALATLEVAVGSADAIEYELKRAMARLAKASKAKPRARAGRSKKPAPTTLA